MSSYRPRSMNPGRRIAATMAALLLAIPATVHAQASDVRLVEDASGWTLLVEGEPFMVLGMNWDYFPIGQNYAYTFWSEPDEMIIAALDREMSLLKSMGVNTIRQYVGVPPRWVKYIYERYGIFTVLNHAVGRYGVTVDGVWIESTDYSDPRTRDMLTAEVLEMVEEFRDTPGVLMWLLGNENNYGLVWSSAETEDLPEGERDAAKARYLYSLFGEITREIKARNTGIPVAMANGDLQYIDIIAEEMQGLDVFGSNVYRGISFVGMFEEVQEKLGVPIMLTEFGADAWNAKEMREDQYTQARYLLGQWKEIYANS
ncbi:MAG: glycosidase, partial [marine benthic group bacterium]|nr:glycosidase [Gemmatimonadota bacterium]